MLAHLLQLVAYTLICTLLVGCSERTVAAPLPSGTIATPVFMAGVPKFLGESRDYDRIFQALADAGVTAFFPTFQYQELPDARSLGYEADFLPPCEADDPAFAAMREHGVKLIVPGQGLYPLDAFPGPDDDPLRALMHCAGEEMIQAVLSIDG